MPEAKLHEIELLGDSIEYSVRSSSEATEPRIDVDIHGVTVVQPKSENVSPNQILRDNAAWVVEKVRKYDKYREQVPDRQFEEGKSFPYLGEPYEVIVERRPSSSITDGKFRLAQHHVKETSIKRALETLYRRNARQRFERRADHFANEMGVEYEEIEIRNQRTRWGSCSTNGILGLNWRLMMAPPEIIDYIIVHEVAHLRQPNHDNEFWSLVAEYDPEYESHAEWLMENSTQLVFSEEDL